MANIISIESVINVAMSMPGVKVDRTEFLKSTFKPTRLDIDKIIEGIPGDFISQDNLDKIAKGIINNHLVKVTAISTATGIPGGIAMLGTVPGDLAQFHWHLLVLAQKLAYVYGWPDLRDENNQLSEQAQSILIIFLGIAFGVKGASKLTNEIATKAALHWSKKLSRMALTKTAWYPIVKKILGAIGVKITTKTPSKWAGKLIPVIGGIISGTMTYASFRKMADRLRKELSAQSDIFVKRASNSDLNEE